MIRPSSTLLTVALVLFATCLPATAQADQMVIKNPGRHPSYSFEAEPHVLVGPFNIGPADDGLGIGFRGTIPIVDNGFISKINNSVGISFGLDWLFFDDRGCYRVRGSRVCYDDGYEYDVVWIPVVMQWNFWLSQNWSVFGEPGLVFRVADDRYFDDDIDIDPTIYVGGRFLVSDSVALVMRLGHPTFSFGVSFLL
jgi:hypothetical protein